MLYSQNNNNNDVQGLLSVGWQTVDLLETALSAFGSPVSSPLDKD